VHVLRTRDGKFEDATVYELDTDDADSIVCAGCGALIFDTP
jgi:hypothetical protein